MKFESFILFQLLIGAMATSCRRRRSGELAVLGDRSTMVFSREEVRPSVSNWRRSFLLKPICDVLKIDSLHLCSIKISGCKKESISYHGFLPSLHYYMVEVIFDCNL